MHQVLALKYRPQKLQDLIGQDVLVSVLIKGLQTRKLPSTFLFHGIRGVGKTTTARIIAKTLNCIAIQNDPTLIDPCNACVSCQAFNEGRHLDIIEIDAATHTSVDDMRELIESARYSPVQGSTKVFIIDEVHMLSKSAFNSLLKTLEEPPSHVKFILATTEIKKIPDTILSRCMRFDLNRMPVTLLCDYLKTICNKEQISYDDDALNLIARAADGSVRDSLSLLDQAIALGGNSITLAVAQKMLGRVDGTFTLLMTLLTQDTPKALQECDNYLSSGAESSAILESLLDTIYEITCLKSVPELYQTIMKNFESKHPEAKQWLKDVSMPDLMRLWQVLLKGYQEIKYAIDPEQSLKMLILRACFLSKMPHAENLLQALNERPRDIRGQTFATPTQTAPTVRQEPAPQFGHTPIPQSTPSSFSKTQTPQSLERTQKPLPSSFKELVLLVKEAKEFRAHAHLVHDVSVVAFNPPALSLHWSSPIIPPNFLEQLTKLFNNLTGHAWIVTFSNQKGEDSLKKQQDMLKQRKEDSFKEHERIKPILETFPGSKVRIDEKG